jgi:N6-L-threonylcarbamoyladenine synthase
MINSKDYDFSFSGLKTAVLYADQKVENKSEEYIQEMCFEVEQAIIDVLLKKTLSAVHDFNAKTVILGGGVSANSKLRSEFELKIKNLKFKILFPEKELSTDNALMIAVAGYYNLNPLSQEASARQRKKIAWQNLSADANLRVGTS